jgi:hypothetical protein
MAESNGHGDGCEYGRLERAALGYRRVAANAAEKRRNAPDGSAAEAAKKEQDAAISNLESTVRKLGDVSCSCARPDRMA